MKSLRVLIMHLNTKLILASNSPRRKQLLKELGYQFNTISIPFDEKFSTKIETNFVAQHLAEKKNETGRKLISNETLITADTTVVFESNILGKPSGMDEAESTIRQLSSKSHQVITGVCVSNNKTSVSFSSTTEVKFKEFTSQEIDFYINKYLPLDKAGSYGIQEWMGMIGVEWIKGSYYNVVGLPVDKLYDVLTNKFNLLPVSYQNYFSKKD